MPIITKAIRIYNGEIIHIRQHIHFIIYSLIFIINKIKPYIRIKNLFRIILMYLSFLYDKYPLNYDHFIIGIYYYWNFLLFLTNYKQQQQQLKHPIVSPVLRQDHSIVVVLRRQCCTVLSVAFYFNNERIIHSSK